MFLSLPHRNEVGFAPGQFPGINPNRTDADDDNFLIANYSEQLLVDYRFYTTRNIIPAFAFGHGLSYTNFIYRNFTCQSSTDIALSIINNGTVPGAEVAQLYLEFPASANSPPMQLKGFVKTGVLVPGQAEVVVFSLRSRDLSVWDSHIRNWVVVTGMMSVTSTAFIMPA